MKKIFMMLMCFALVVAISACSEKNTKMDIELMGAGDRIHDTFTFANIGVELKEKEDNVYEISGSVEKLEDENVKQEFKIEEDVDNVVAIKLSANGRVVEKEKISVKVDGVRNYDAEHLNGEDYTFVILEAVKGKAVSIEVSWNGVDVESYVIQFSENLTIK